MVDSSETTLVEYLVEEKVEMMAERMVVLKVE
jgi:hypothetical protein